MRRKESGDRLKHRSANKAVREAHTLAEWHTLYRRNPRAVPPEVQRTLERRGLVKKG